MIHLPQLLAEQLEIPRSSARMLIDTGKVKVDGAYLSAGEHDLLPIADCVVSVDEGATQTLIPCATSASSAAVDEAPAAYKRLADVLWHHRDTIKVRHTLTPLGVAMAGSDVPADD